jgi:hypothetical protein
MKDLPMRKVIFLALICCATPAWAAPSAKELAKEAVRIEQLASQETDATKKQELKKQACAAWNAAYDAGKRFEYQLSIGTCKQELQDLDGAETAFRSFLALAPTSHQDRPIAEQALAQIVEQKQAYSAATASSPALSISGPIPIQESKTQWKRKALFAGGTLTGLGLVGGAIAFGVLRSQDDISRGTTIIVEQP